MSWQDRISEAAYTSPGGTRIVFQFENVSSVIEKRTAAFDFPDAEGTYVQDNGISSTRYPLRVIFWGDDYDLEARTFERLLSERGRGKLEHPIYGTTDVVPFGRIVRRDDLKTAANQTIIEVTFWESIGLIYPTAQEDPASGIVEAVTEYNSAKSLQFETNIDLDQVVDSATFKGRYLGFLNTTRDRLQLIADTKDSVRDQFNAIADSINQGIDVLISDPLTLAFQTTLLIQSPARSIAGIGARLDAYNDLLQALITGDGAVVDSDTVENSNEFYNRDLYASTYITGSILSVVNNEFETKTDAITAAESIIGQFNSLVAWRDSNYDVLANIDTGEAYQKLLDAVAITAGFLVEISFSLKQERRFITDRPHTIIDLVASLYGEVDPSLDLFIRSNDLTGSEILEIPAGREIVIYV